jgi:hypothetical protein
LQLAGLFAALPHPHIRKYPAVKWSGELQTS